MDEHELEQRLRARLHARFDSGRPSEAFRADVLRSLTPAAARGGGLRLAFSAVWPVLAAAAVLVIAVGVWALRPPTPIGPGSTPSASPTPTSSSSASPSATTGPSASPSAPATASPSAAPSPSSAAAPTSWTSLSVTKLTDAPAGLATVVPWSGGYVGFATDAATSKHTAWISQDGQAWTALPAATFGLNDPSGMTLPVGGTRCRNDVVVHVSTSSGQDVLWSSTDGITWTPTALPSLGQSIAGNGSGAVVVRKSGTGVDVTTDCRNWQTSNLPAQGTASVTAVAATSAGFVAVGNRGTADTNTTPLAWYSADGRQWSEATVPARKGDGYSVVAAGTSGFIAISYQPGITPGITSLWTSTDGHRWTPSNSDPLGVVEQCAGAGSLAGGFTGDGTRLLVSGPNGGCSGPNEFWVSLDGSHWTKLALTGTASAVTSGNGNISASLMRDGILFSNDSGTWFGQATNP